MPRLSLVNGSLDLAAPLIHGVDVGAQGCGLPFEFLQAMELFEAGMHDGDGITDERGMQNAERRRGTGSGHVDSGSHEAERPAPPKPQAKAGDNGSVQNVSDSPDQVLDVVVIGAGPVGLACAIEARNAGLTARVLDKGALVNSIVGYPARMEFFSTPDLIEIGGHPFPVQGYKPTREEGIEYYRGVAAREAGGRQALRAGHRPAWRAGRRSASRPREACTAPSCHRRDRVLRSAESPWCARRGPAARHALLSGALPYVQQRVAIIGAKNSAAKAALDCYRHGAQVTWSFAAPRCRRSIKYWIKPDLENRIKEGSIRAYLQQHGRGDSRRRRSGRDPGGTVDLPNDFVLAMTGYQPDFAFLATLGITFADDGFRTPVFDEVTFESARPGVFLAGTVCGGLKTNRWFIENGRFHAQQIVKHLAGQRTEAIPFASIHWKTEE